MELTDSSQVKVYSYRRQTGHMQRQWARLTRRGRCAGVVPTCPRSLERARREMRQAESPGRGVSQDAFPPALYLEPAAAPQRAPAVLGNRGMGVMRVKPGGLGVCSAWNFTAEHGECLAIAVGFNLRSRPW